MQKYEELLAHYKSKREEERELQISQEEFEDELYYQEQLKQAEQELWLAAAHTIDEWDSIPF